ncbi:MAG: TMEM175 family protein [bacterium]|nr:TMEM175 family protein [bacterium]
MNDETVNAASTAISKTRLEILFDGIFAIAMTILVLELKAPELSDRHSIPEMALALWLQRATFFSYLLSFTILGIMWYRHNHLFRHFHRITGGMFALHILMLASAAFFPFCATLMGRYPTNPLTMTIYTGCILIYQ